MYIYIYIFVYNCAVFGTKFVNQFTMHRMNNMKMINAHQARIIHQYKNAKQIILHIFNNL